MEWEAEWKELEFKLSHWNREYLFHKDNAISGIFLIFISYLCYLFILINNKNIEIGYFMYVICIYCILWTIIDIFKFKKAIKMRDYFDNELLIHFTKRNENNE